MSLKYMLPLAFFLPSIALGQDLVGDNVDVTPFFFPNATTVTVIDPGVELPNAGPTLGLGGSSGRFDVDITSDTVRVDFTVEQDLGSAGVPLLTFSDLDPVCPDGQIGTVVGVSVDTNIDPARIIIDGAGILRGAYQGDASFTDTSVAIEQVSQDRFVPGDYIELSIDFSCPGLTLTFDGACPGIVDVEVLGMTPGGTIAVIKGTGPGSFTVPVGPCAGTPMDITGASFVTFATDGDGDGMISASPFIGPGTCGSYVQLVDLTTCETSNVAVP